jgi:non-specific serine/threonine protein kinase
VVGKIAYVVGGLVAGGGATDVVEAYEPPFWLEVPPLPIKIHHAMAAALDGKLVVLGGFVGELGGPATRRVFILDGRGGPWREGPPMRRARGAGAAVAVGAEIIVVGGISDGKHVGPIEIFDGTAWRDGTPIPSLRDHLGAATDGKLVYAAGGRRGGGHFATFDVYDPGADRWSSLPDMPTPRSGNGVTFAGGSVIAAGGEGPRIFPEAEAYDVATGRWRRLPNLAMPVHGVGLVTLGTDVYAFGGGIRVGLAPSRACQVLAIA